MEVRYGTPVSGIARAQTAEFLSALGLSFDEGVSFTVNLLEDGEIVASGSRGQNVLKCIGVSPDRQGEGLTGTLVTELTKNALEAGYRHLFVFTSPASAPMFRNLGFYDVAATDDIALLENERGGIDRFVESLPGREASARAGCVVANCNPFTNGHLYLVETAAARCDALYLFILSEERSRFPAKDRMKLAVEATAHLKNVTVLPTSDYLISSATFPDYFLKERNRIDDIKCELDIKIFAEKFASALDIRMRFAGTEPVCPVTRAYNERMRELLPAYGIEFVEIPRAEAGGGPVSASRVRALFDAGKLDDIRPLVPEPTMRYLEAWVNDAAR